MSLPQILHFIDGQFRPSSSALWIDNYNPATGAVYSLIADGTTDDIDQAVSAANKAFPLWSTMTSEQRSKILLSIAQKIEERIDEFAQAESQDQGKPLWLAKAMDIPRAIANFRFFATEILHVKSDFYQTTQSQFNYTMRTPLGVVGCISPWNLPLYLFTWKIAPALAAGNCVVAKPSELTPLTASLLGSVCQEAGLPNGVLNIVHGYGQSVGAAIVHHPSIKAISFTGSTRTGEYIATSVASTFKKVSLELGGKNPVVVYADADIDKAVEECVRGAFLNQGEICLCGSRLYIERRIYTQFRDAFVKLASTYTVGDPLESQSKLGAIVGKDHFDKVMNCIAIAKKEGGTILLGGNSVRPNQRCSNGWFIEPTIIEGLPVECQTNQEEIFGPVVTLEPFDSEEESIALANATKYGLASILWTQNLSQAHRVAAKMECGIVWVNCWLQRDLRTPFGGVKNSGIGREGGTEALRFFTEVKNICVSL